MVGPASREGIGSREDGEEEEEEEEEEELLDVDDTDAEELEVTVGSGGVTGFVLCSSEEDIAERKKERKKEREEEGSNSLVKSEEVQERDETHSQGHTDWEVRRSVDAVTGRHWIKRE